MPRTLLEPWAYHVRRGCGDLQFSRRETSGSSACMLQNEHCAFICAGFYSKDHEGPHGVRQGEVQRNAQWLLEKVSFCEPCCGSTCGLGRATFRLVTHLVWAPRPFCPPPQVMFLLGHAMQGGRCYYSRVLELHCNTRPVMFVGNCHMNGLRTVPEGNW